MEARDFKRESFAVNGLIASTAVLAVAGVLAMFLPLDASGAAALKVVCVVAFAGVAGFALWVANAAAGCAQILLGHRDKHSLAFGIALACAGLTGLVSVVGVHLGWMMLIGERQGFPDMVLIDAAGLGLGFVKVAMGFVISACVDVERSGERSHDVLLETKDKRIRELEAEVRRLSSQQEKPFAANDEAPPQEPRPRASPAAARAISREVRGARPREQRRPLREIRETAERGPPLTEDALREIIAEMTAQGAVINFSSVHRFAKVPYSRVERSPGRHLVEAAAKAA